MAVNSRASKNLAMSGGKSIGRLIVGGLKKIGKSYMKSHKAKQEKIDKYGKEVMGS